LGSIADPRVLTLFGEHEAMQPQLIPMEINLEGFPLFSRQKTPEGRALEVHQSVSTNNGHRLNQLWRVTASHDFSLPGTFDEDVFVGVMALVRRRGGMPKDGKIRFSIYELIKMLGKSKRGGFYKKVRDSLDRIGSTIYYSENAFYVAEDESLETYRFTLWTVHFSRAKGTQGRAAEHHTLKFDDIIIRSYNAGYLKLLDTDLYFALKIPLAKALYRLVDQRRQGSSSWSLDVRELRDLLAMSKSYAAPSRIWEVLQPAHRTLRREKFLESAILDGDTARYRIHREFARNWLQEGVEPAPSLTEKAIEALKGQGVWPKRARSLVERFGPEKAFHALDILEARGGVDNQGAYVAEVVEKGNPEELAEMAAYLQAQRERSGTKVGSSHGQLSLVRTARVGRKAHPPPQAPVPDPQAEEEWGLLLGDVQKEIDVSSLRIWFEGIVPVHLDDNTLTISVPNSFAQEYIESRFGVLLTEIHRRRNGGDARLEVVVGERA
jgi:hypothetical protein